MKVHLKEDWTVKAVNGSDVTVPKGTEIDLPEALNEAHAQEVAVGAKLIIGEAPAPPEPEAPKHKPTKAKPHVAKPKAEKAKDAKTK